MLSNKQSIFKQINSKCKQSRSTLDIAHITLFAHVQNITRMNLLVLLFFEEKKKQNLGI